MLKKILLVLLVLVIAFVATASFQPNTYELSRSTTIAASPDVVFEQINDFHNWRAWSPWEQLDSNMTRNIEGPPTGVGANYSWVGNSDAGAGKMEITSSNAPTDVAIALHFKEPMESEAKVDFALTPDGNNTNVVWRMSGDANLFTKMMNLAYGMDKLVGPDFERGLAQLKSVAEAEQAKRNAAPVAAAVPTDTVKR